MRIQHLIRWLSALFLSIIIVYCHCPVAYAVNVQDSPEFDLAVKRYRNRIRKDPKNLALHRELIELAQQTNRLEIPLHVYKTAYQKQPTNTIVLYVLGYAYLREGSESSLMKAKKLLETAIEERPQFADAYAALGRCYAAQWKTEEAMEAYQRSVQLDPNLWEAHFELGNYYRDGKNYQKAIEHYTKSLSDRPKAAEIHFHLGTLYRKTGDLESARQAFSQTIKHDKGYADAYYQMGQIFALQQKPKEALKQYRKGREFDPKNAKTRYQLALIFLDGDDGRNAILAVRSALAVDAKYTEYVNLLKNVSTLDAVDIAAQILQKHPDNAELQHFVGMLFLKIGQWETAQAHLERAKALDPNNADVRFTLAESYEHKAPDKAIEEYKQAAELGKTRLDLLLKLVERYRQEKNFEKFQQIAQQILTIDANQPEVHYQLSNYYDEQSNRKKQAGEEEEAETLLNLAIEHANKAAKLAPRVGAYHLKLATFYDRQKQLKAIRSYDKAIELDPYNAEAYYRRGLFMSNYTFGEAKVLLYNPKDVMDDLQKAIQLDPNLAGAHYALGVAYDRMGNVQKAMVEFQKAGDLDRSDPRPHLYLGEKYANAGQFHMAIAAFAKAIKAHPENVEALKDYAFLCLAHDEERGWKQAKRALEKAIQIRPNDAEILMNYGYTLYLSRKNDDAIAHYLRSIELKPDWPLSRYNLAIAYEQIGKKELALTEYQKVTKLDPEGLHAEKALERIQLLTDED